VSSGAATRLTEPRSPAYCIPAVHDRTHSLTAGTGMASLAARLALGSQLQAEPMLQRRRTTPRARLNHLIVQPYKTRPPNSTHDGWRARGRNGGASDWSSTGRQLDPRPRRDCVRRLWATCSHQCDSTPTVFVTISSRYTQRSIHSRPSQSTTTATLSVSLRQTLRQFQRAFTA